MPGWNPEQYLKFAGPRLRPALDLLARIDVVAPRSVFDLGCGAGNVTRVLTQRWPGAAVTGVDDSPQMLAAAARSLPRVTWVQQSLQDWRAPAPADVIFSNAALHWLPDHPALFPRLFDQLAPGGVLAVQMPRNFAAPSHTAMTETAAEGPWRDRLASLPTKAPVPDPAFYYRLLAMAASLDIWETEYLHVLEGENPVKEWTKGSGLKTYLDALDTAQAAAFEAAYATRVSFAYPRQPDGKTLFLFRRLFIVARR